MKNIKKYYFVFVLIIILILTATILVFSFQIYKKNQLAKERTEHERVCSELFKLVRSEKLAECLTEGRRCESEATISGFNATYELTTDECRSSIKSYK